MRTITVVPYDPNWKNEYKRIKEEILTALQGLDVTVEHIGSTSVPELYAKPIIDIDIIIKKGMFDTIAENLTTIGYHHVGDLGIQGREAFNYNNKPHLMEHHLYVCNEDSAELKRHIALRNFLRQNQDYRQKYSQIKLETAQRHPHDIDAYIEGKQPLILEIYQKLGLHITNNIK